MGVLAASKLKATIFQWTLEHDVAMRSPERGQVWDITL